MFKYQYLMLKWNSRNRTWDACQSVLACKRRKCANIFMRLTWMWHGPDAWVIGLLVKVKRNSPHVNLSLRHHAHLTHWRHSEKQQSKRQIITKTSRTFYILCVRVKHNSQNVKLSLRHHAHLTHWRQSETDSENIKLSPRHHAHLTHWRPSETRQWKHQIITKTSRAFNTLTSEWNTTVKTSNYH